MSPSRALLLCALALCAWAGSSTAQLSEKLVAQNPCISKSSCRECIQTASCAWCSQPNFGDQPRCFLPGPTNEPGSCAEEFAYNPVSYPSVLDDRKLSKDITGTPEESSTSQLKIRRMIPKKGITGTPEESSTSQLKTHRMIPKKGQMSAGASGGSMSGGSMSGGYEGGSFSGSESGSFQEEVVQISPQKVHLALRINEVYKMEVKYSQAMDYPVDLYYLMDLSKSMEDDKDSLSALGDLLSDSMRNITSNFRLGFGSFVDKVVMPYVSTVPKNLLEPCTGCAAPYGYRNVMSLSTDTHHFAGQVRNAAVSGNLDAPEGGFDAIMQAVVCRREIGWREKARRLLVFSTDAGFHYAGDGKLGGIVKPNDGSCHLDSQGMYTHSSLQDYPSISQVNLKVKENAINVIFAVTAEQISVYEKLKEHIEGSSAGTLSADSSNIVHLVKDQYQKISSSVEMKDNSTSAVRVTYYSSCKGSTREATNKCDDLRVGDLVTFTAEIVVTSCPKDPNEWNQVFQIYPVGINESLIIDLQMLCDCPCERPGHPGFEMRSKTHCNGFGTYACGVCECEPQHFGGFCECSAQDMHGGGAAGATGGCRQGNTTTVDCSGRGNCVCGQCECERRSSPDEHISGKFCECDNFSCDRHNGLLCSGEEHGKCECGQCLCQDGWSGPACDCRATNDTCIPPGGGEVCGGHGECVCGQCVCGMGEEGRYSGRFCDKCPTCPGRCAEFKDCVQCQMYKTGPLSEEECASNCTFVPIGVQVVEANEEKDENMCAYYDEEYCRFSYVYAYDENDKVIIRAQQERECPPQVFMLGIVLAVIAAIVLIGLALILLWKMVTSIHDRREFARFEKERMMAKWDTGENPIYKQATSTFKNPTYAGK